MAGGVTVIGDLNPLARVVLRVLRDRDTGYEDFRRYMRIAGALLATYSLPSVARFRDVEVVTPLDSRARELKPEGPLYVIGVLGAAIPLLEGFIDVAPWARVGLVAARRIEEGGRVMTEVFYVRLPKRLDGPAIVVDPMLATGGTVRAALRVAAERGAERLAVASVIAAKPGIEAVRREFPEADIYTLAVDPELDHRYFIVPGLGDAGDRALGAEA